MQKGQRTLRAKKTGRDIIERAMNPFRNRLEVKGTKKPAAPIGVGDLLDWKDVKPLENSICSVMIRRGMPPGRSIGKHWKPWRKSSVS
jgi:hypothetical protein